MVHQKISFFTLGVKDLERMKNFYKEVFGWVPEKDNDGIVFFKLNGFIFGLYPVDALAEDIGIRQDGQDGFKGCTLAMNYRSEAEVDLTFTTLVTKGARAVLQPERVVWGGYRGYIADPENNYWELAFNPFLEMDDQGNIRSHQ